MIRRMMLCVVLTLAGCDEPLDDFAEYARAVHAVMEGAPLPRLPWVGKQMVYTMAGLKTGWFGFDRGIPEKL